MPDISRVFDSPAALAAGAAQRLVTLADQAIRDRGICTLALAGGSTPKAMHAELVAHHAAALDWSKVHVYFGDERCVGPEHPDSNYAMASSTLLGKLPLRPDHVHRIRGELSPDQAAADYERTLRAAFPSSDREPALDIVLLGMGADGHTASLFPDHDFHADLNRWVTTAIAPPQSPVKERVSLTIPFISRARRVLFALAGADKTARLAEVMAARRAGAQKPPAAMITCRGDVEWLTDRAAAGLA